MGNKVDDKYDNLNKEFISLKKSVNELRKFKLLADKIKLADFNFKIENFLNKEEFNNIFKLFYNATGVPVSLCSSDGETIANYGIETDSSLQNIKLPIDFNNKRHTTLCSKDEKIMTIIPLVINSETVGYTTFGPYFLSNTKNEDLSKSKIPTFNIQKQTDTIDYMVYYTNMVSDHIMKNALLSIQIKEMSGLIPICRVCKNIRNDSGFWDKTENYIERNSETVFSHGICNECKESLYGDQEWYKSSKKNDTKNIVELTEDINTLKQEYKSLSQFHILAHQMKMDSENICFSDLIDPQFLQEMMTKFYKATRIPIGIIDVAGNIIAGTGWQKICTHFHRVNPDSCQNCSESDNFITNHLFDDVPYIQYKCKNGIWDCAVPIVARDIHLATLFVGQFIYDDEQIDEKFFRNQAKKFSFDEREYIDSLRDMRIFTRDEMTAIMAYYSGFAKLISNYAFNNLELSQRLKQLQVLLPICSNCKKIRDDSGYWKQIDEFMESNSDIIFEQEECPDCKKKQN